jgi:transcriptional regulator with XRE-family HTH domain
MSENDDITAANEGWLKELEEKFERDADYIAEGLALEITEEVARLMRQKGISRADLAESLNVSRAYVTRILNAPPNLTLRSIAELAIALGTTPHVSLTSECHHVSHMAKELSSQTTTEDRARRLETLEN